MLIFYIYAHKMLTVIQLNTLDEIVSLVVEFRFLTKCNIHVLFSLTNICHASFSFTYVVNELFSLAFDRQFFVPYFRSVFSFSSTQIARK